MKLPIVIHLGLLLTFLFSTVWLAVPATTQAKETNEIPIITSSLTPAACELRGVWLNYQAFESKEAIADTLQVVSRANLNTIFALVPPIGTNRGWSEEAMFKRLMRRARAKGISVHGWVVNMHRPIGQRADFTDPAEREAQKQWVLDLLAKYPDLDGIHFDYIRYYDWDLINNNGKMDGITQTVAESYQALKAKYPDKFMTAAIVKLDPVEASFGQENVPQWYLDWFARYPGNVYANPNGVGPHMVPRHLRYQQNPVEWLNSAIIDGIFGMQYTIDDDIWQRDVRLWQSFLENTDHAQKVYMGLGWLESSKRPDFAYDPPGLVRKINYGRAQGIRGFVIFEIAAFNERNKELVEALTVDSEVNNFAAPFKTPAISCFTPIKSNIFLPILTKK